MSSPVRNLILVPIADYGLLQEMPHGLLWLHETYASLYPFSTLCMAYVFLM